MSGQSTQYNAIMKPYEEVMKATAPIVSRVNVRQMVTPFIKDAVVLDMACGTGFFTQMFIKMGARKVVGVDISSGMLQQARANNAEFGDRATFIEADGTKAVEYPGGLFDFVFGGYFLNYAPDKKTMVAMYRNILLNLKPGGKYIGVQPVASDDPEELYERERILRPLHPGGRGLYTTVKEKLEDGILIHRETATTVGEVHFDTYHLRKDVYEAAAKEAGFKGEVEWADSIPPDDFLENPTKYGESHNGGGTPEEIATFHQIPHMGFLTLVK